MLSTQGVISNLARVEYFQDFLGGYNSVVHFTTTVHYMKEFMLQSEMENCQLPGRLLQSLQITTNEGFGAVFLHA